jgi:CCR4-NOT complex subunit CAF16
MIETKELVYVFPDGTVGIHPTTFQLPSGSRTLLIGANGAGKSTLLKVLSGKTLAKAGTVAIDGKDPFRDGIPGITYLGTEWAGNPTVRHDVPVTLLISSIGGDQYPERRDELIDILDVDLRWRMHAVSDGERRRVQLVMGLLKPWTILLLDEVTVDLDVLVRDRLLKFLRTETESRDCQIVSVRSLNTLANVALTTGVCHPYL